MKHKIFTTAAIIAAIVFAGIACKEGGAESSGASSKKIEMVKIEGGTFTMGSPKTEPERLPGEIQHQVTVSSFYMSKYEITQKEYYDVTGQNRSNFKGKDLPVENVSWYDAVEYCNNRSLKEGLTPAYIVDETKRYPNSDNFWVVTWNRDANGYRLPTEAEWEYACRAGTTTAFNTGDNITADQANYNGSMPYNDPFKEKPKETNREKTTPVGSFKPNAWGLYDMHGNVKEWCWDWDGSYSTQAQTDPTGPDTAPIFSRERVIRGGSWKYSSSLSRSAYRADSMNIFPNDRRNDVGFRVARNQ